MKNQKTETGATVEVKMKSINLSLGEYINILAYIMLLFLSIIETPKNFVASILAVNCILLQLMLNMQRTQNEKMKLLIGSLLTDLKKLPYAISNKERKE